MTLFLSKTNAAGAALLALLGSVVALPACGSHGGGGAARTEQPDTIICGYFESTSGGNAQLQPEYYLLSVMNAKLRSFPDFAAKVGRSSVSDCDGARTVYSTYLGYLHDHPGFDDNQPVAPHPPLHSFVPPLPPHTTKKVFNGTPSGFLPVVYLVYYVPPGTQFFDHSNADGGPPATIQRATACTGYFIAKNWIATAAHCLANIALQAPIAADTGNQPPAQWITAYPWSIAWPDDNGGVVNTTNPTSVDSSGNTIINLAGKMTALQNAYLVSVADPAFMGITNPTNVPAAMLSDATTAAHDFALLYVDPANYDGHLPPVPGTTVVNGNVTTSTIPVLSTSVEFFWTLTAYGYGKPPGQKIATLGSGDISGNFRLSGTAMAGYPIDGVAIADDIPSGGFTFTSLCSGDSGGPLVHDFGDNVLAAVGTNSETFSGGQCAMSSGDESVWTRDDVEVPFIQQSLQLEYSSAFQCTPGPAPAGQSNYVQCWGTPCSSNCDCSPSQYCSNPAALDPSSPFQTGEDQCNVCDDGTCDCLKGQCLPRPDDFDGGDMNSDGGCSADASDD